MQIEIVVDQLTDQGLNIAMEQLTGFAAAWASDWSVTGPLLERERIEVHHESEPNAVREVFAASSPNGADNTPWTATLFGDRSHIMEFGTTALQAVVRAYVAGEMESGRRVSVSAASAASMLREVAPLIEALYTGSDKHVATEVSPDRFRLEPVSGSADAIEAFGEVRRMVEAVHGQGLRRVSSGDSDPHVIEVHLL